MSLCKSLDNQDIDNQDIDNFLNMFAIYHNIDYNDIRNEWNVWNTFRSNSKCPYVFTKGTRKNTKCGQNTNGTCYCIHHKQYENIGQKIKNNMTTPTNKQIRGTIKNQEMDKKSIYIVKHRNKDFFWHPETRFVFDKTTKKVIGVYSDDKIMKLNDQDKMICKTYGFKLQL